MIVALLIVVGGCIMWLGSYFVVVLLRSEEKPIGSGNQLAQEPADATGRSEAPKTPSD